MISGNLRVISWLNHRRFVKYVFDRIVAATALLLLSPVMLMIAIAIHFKMGSPVVFTQARPGQHSKVFQFYKFRTMTDARDKEGNLLPDEVRLTAFGQFLRKTSLDELPQLWNVVKGDMSFIGPRPLIVKYLERYDPEQARRHDVLPGITGLAQVKGRNTIAWEDKFKWDVWYVDNWSLWLDLKIFIMTVFKVLRQDGISQEGYATSEEFKGSVREN
jgi:lipopolysaccharide/colanic/teichoic acid biosynthesis glycosyltransferase